MCNCGCPNCPRCTCHSFVTAPASKREPRVPCTVAVIDYDDPEQVERLDDLLHRFVMGDEIPKYEGTVGATRAALREFASPTPPKCDSVLNIAGVHYHCDRDMGHDFGAHGNRDAHAIWSTS